VLCLASLRGAERDGFTSIRKVHEHPPVRGRRPFCHFGPSEAKAVSRWPNRKPSRGECPTVSSGNAVAQGLEPW
jgi:hypothetical protein